MTADAECIFCRIAAGEIPCAEVLSDDVALAFMDIGPVADGHVLLIPRAHYLTVDEMPEDLAGAVLRHVPALVRAVRQATGCEGVNVLQNNGRVAGQAVPHVHFHVIPREADGRFAFNWPAETYPPGRADELAGAIRAALGAPLGG